MTLNCYRLGEDFRDKLNCVYTVYITLRVYSLHAYIYVIDVVLVYYNITILPTLNCELQLYLNHYTYANISTNGVYYCTSIFYSM